MALQKLWKMIFISSEKIFRSWDIRIFIVFSRSFPHFPDLKGQMKIE